MPYQFLTILILLSGSFFRLNAQSNKQIKINGLVTNQKTYEPERSFIRLANNNVGNIILSTETNDLGQFTFSLDTGIIYTVEARMDGFFSDYYDLDLMGITKDSIAIQLSITPIELSAAISINNIYFDAKETKLKEAGIIELERIVYFLRENESISMQIEGHSSNRGNQASQMKRSEKRAQNVMDYLISKGIDKERLSIAAYGGTQPLTSEKDPQGEVLNNRVTFRIIGD